ncbi:nicotinamide riboside transporter PnuC, partial [Patescibacteria group bacterium]|nr:nicotinamide riboside transporter PnuC [Patescibacteria group bacterium]
RKKNQDSDQEGRLQITTGRSLELGLAAGTILVGTTALGMLMTRIHLLLPTYFLAPADYPYLDALTTVMSFVATVLMVRRKLACWYLWISVDFIGIWLYWVKGVKFISVEYVIFLVLASYGLYKWHLSLKEREAYEKVSDRSSVREVLPTPSRT